MKLKVTGLTIDWHEEFDWIDPVSSAERTRITESIIGTVWDALADDDGSDLVNQITNVYGWLIESINYKAECTCDPTCGSGCEVCCEDESNFLAPD